MKRYFVMAILFMIPFASFAQTKTAVALSEGATLLFKNTKSKLTNDQKNWLFKQLNFTLSGDKKKYLLPMRSQLRVSIPRPRFMQNRDARYVPPEPNVESPASPGSEDESE